jgi:hypothetical protein
VTGLRDFRRLAHQTRRRLVAVRGLRTRLMVAYAVFFAIFLTGLAAVFRARLVGTLDTEAHDALNGEWVSLKGGILRIRTKKRRSSTSKRFFSSPTEMGT